MASIIRKQSSTGMMFVGLAVALTLTGVVTIQQWSRSPATSSPEELDRIAQQHFRLAQVNVPGVVRELSSVKGVATLCYLMTRDKISGTERVREFLAVKLALVLQPCQAGVRAYGLELNSAVFNEEIRKVSTSNIAASVYAASGLVLETAFIKPTIASFKKVFASVAVRLSGIWGGGAVCAASDGFFPFGDTIGLAMAIGGTAWCGYDLWQSRTMLPQELAATLRQAIRDCRETCRKEVRR